jgi:hypothetical protein
MVIDLRGVQAAATAAKRRRAARGELALLLLLCVAGVSRAAAQAQAPAAQASPAETQPAETQPTGVQEPRDYDRTIESALNEYRLGNWEEATALFTQAHALRPSARTLRGMGLSEFENRKYVIALAHCSAALADTRNPLSDEQRAELESVIERASEFVARVKLTLSPEDASVTVDGAVPYRDAAGNVLLDPGPHELVASDLRGSERRRIDAASGQLLELTLTVRPNAVAPAQAQAAKDSGRVPAAQVLTYVGLAVLGVGLAVGTTAGVIVLDKAGELDDACSDHLCPEDQRKELEQSEDLAVVANVAFAVAGAGAAAAVVGLVLAHGGGDDAEQAEGVRVSVQPFGAVLSGRF